METNEEVLVPLIVFASFTVVIGMVLWYRIKRGQSFLRFLGDRQDVSAEAITALGDQFFSQRNDLRRGIFSLGLAFAFWGFSYAVDFPQNGNLDLNHAIVGLGLFPFFTGIAYLLLFKLDNR